MAATSVAPTGTEPLPPAAAPDAGQPPAIALACGDTQASVLTRGAEWCHWACGGRELLWSGDPRWWPRHSPLLFPAVGRLRDGLAWFGGTPHRMPVHGFASTSPFVVTEQAADRVALLLHSDEHTRAAYPFAFELAVTYRLAPSVLTIEVTLRNAGAIPMPYSLGLHPGFRWPWVPNGAEGHTIVFADDERPEVPVITTEGLFTEARRPLPLAGGRLPLATSLFADEALCFLDARSRALAFEAPDGSAIEIEAQGFAHWALWSPPGAPLLSIEAWTGHGDTNDFRGEFGTRASTRWLAPQDSAGYGLQLRFRPGSSAP